MRKDKDLIARLTKRWFNRIVAFMFFGFSFIITIVFIIMILHFIGVLN